MDIHKEIKLEDEICEHLSTNYWLYADKINVREFACGETV